MPSVYFFGKRTEIFFVTLFYEVLIKTDMRNDLVTSSMKVSVFLETHHSSIFLKMNTICLAIIFLTHKLFSNQIKISDKKKKKEWKSKLTSCTKMLKLSCVKKANKKSFGLSSEERMREVGVKTERQKTQNLTVKYEHMEFWLAKEETGFSRFDWFFLSAWKVKF